MSLLSLPNELLIMVLECILPGDIANFSMICRRVNQLSTPMMKEHQRLAPKYSDLHLYRHTIDSAFLDYCVKPYRLAQYPERLILHEWRAFIPPPEENLGVTFGQVCVRVKEMGFMTAQRIIYWYDRLFYHHAIISAFMLPCLPNLRCLKLGGQSVPELQCLRDIVGGIVKSGRRSGHHQALSRLSQIEIEIGPSRRHHLKYFVPFMALPSLRSFVAKRLMCLDSKGIQFEPCCSQVEHLQLFCSLISKESYPPLLRSFKALKRFAYATTTGNLIVPSIISSLREYHQDTLEELTLINRQHFDHFIGSLCSFTALKVVVINHRFLLNARKMPRFVDLFPPSIESVSIWGDFEDGDERGLFTDFSRLRESCFPNLRSIIADDGLPRSGEFIPPKGPFRFTYTMLRKGSRAWSGLDAAGKWTHCGSGTGIFSVWSMKYSKKHRRVLLFGKSQSPKPLLLNQSLREHIVAVVPDVR